MEVESSGPPGYKKRGRKRRLPYLFATTHIYLGLIPVWFPPTFGLRRTSTSFSTFWNHEVYFYPRRYPSCHAERVGSLYVLSLVHNQPFSLTSSPRHLQDASRWLEDIDAGRSSTPKRRAYPRHHLCRHHLQRESFTGRRDRHRKCRRHHWLQAEQLHVPPRPRRHLPRQGSRVRSELGRQWFFLVQGMSPLVFILPDPLQLNVFFSRLLNGAHHPSALSSSLHTKRTPSRQPFQTVSHLERYVVFPLIISLPNPLTQSLRSIWLVLNRLPCTSEPASQRSSSHAARSRSPTEVLATLLVSPFPDMFLPTVRSYIPPLIPSFIVLLIYHLPLDPGVVFDIYNNGGKPYTVPGPAVWRG